MQKSGCAVGAGRNRDWEAIGRETECEVMAIVTHEIIWS
jgi:hypothetical protein